MWDRRMTVLGISLIACCWIAAQLTPPLSAQQKVAGGESAESAKESELDLLYAKAHLKLLEATLARYEDMNRTAPNTVRPTVIQAIQDAVLAARERVPQGQAETVNDSASYVTQAEARFARFRRSPETVGSGGDSKPQGDQPLGNRTLEGQTRPGQGQRGKSPPPGI